MEDVHKQQTEDLSFEIAFMGIRQENMLIIRLFGSYRYDEFMSEIKFIHVRFYFSTFMVVDRIH